MRPALLWLRTLVILATVLLTMGKGAWALTSADQFDQTEAVDTWCCQQEELAELTEVAPSDEAAPERKQHVCPGGDEDRGELMIPHQPWKPAPLIGTHPPIPADLSPVQPWLSLPLRPPKG